MHSPTIRCLVALLFTCAAARADFQNGQPAVLALGEPAQNKSYSYATGVAVDAATHKVFVCDQFKHRVLRFSSAESLQNGGAAEAVLGQPDFQSTGPGLSATRFNQPVGVAVSADGRLYVADRINYRVLRFDHAATIASGSPADGVLGQVDFTVGTSLNTSSTSMDYPAAVAVDPTGRLWVADEGNQRVLRFDQAADKPPGAAADGVLGQSDFTTSSTGVSVSGMSYPGGLAVDGTLRLWVSDEGSHRVTLFNNPAAKANGATADKVLGQPDFVSSAAPASPVRNRLKNPLGLAASGGTLWVSDRDHWRVLRFDAAHTKSNGANADGVLGQSSYTTDDYGTTTAALDRPRGLALDGGRLWIVDGDNNRVLRHENAAFIPNGSGAVSMLGDTSLTKTSLFYVNATRFGAGAKGITVDPLTGKVFVCDTGNHRVLRFASGAALISGAAAEGVLGQNTFSGNALGSNGADMRNPSAVAMDHNGHLWVADTGNHRVLRFDTPATAENGRGADAELGQQSINANTPETTIDRMRFPQGLVVQSSFNRTTQLWTTTHLWVADSGNHRVLRFSNPVTAVDGASAAAVLGQSSFTTANYGTASFAMDQPTGLALDNSGVLWVADTVNNRVLRFDAAAAKANGAAANGVLLQPAFGVNNAGPTAALGKFPVGVCVTPQGRLFVADSGDRVVWFNNAADQVNGAVIHGMLGFTGSLVFPTATTPGYWNNLFQPSACSLDDSGHLWVMDTGNKRALRFTPSLDSTITAFGLNAQSKFNLTMSALVGETYELRSSPDLLDWSTIEGEYRATIGSPFGVLNWTAPTAAGGKRFYRLQAP